MCSRDVIKFSNPKLKEPLKVLSSSVIRGAKFISIYNLPARQHPSFGKQRNQNFGKRFYRVCQKNIHLSRDFLAVLGVKVLENVFV